jgi:hypothetical protein
VTSADEELAAYERVQFGVVAVGSFFKEASNGCWMLKTARGTGLYRCRGVEGEARFDKKEEVLIQLGQGQATTQGQGG